MEEPPDSGERVIDMGDKNTLKIKTITRRGVMPMLLCVVGTLMNLCCSALAEHFHAMLYLDAIGTIAASVLGGYLPGVIVGLLTNLVRVYFDHTAIYYGSLNVLIAVVTAFFAEKGFFKKIGTTIISIFIISLVGGGLGSILTWVLYGFAGEGITADFAQSLQRDGLIAEMQAQFYADYLIDLIDKTISVSIVLFLCHFIPESVKNRLKFVFWLQSPLLNEAIKKAKTSKSRQISLRMKILLMLLLASVSIAVSATSISFALYRKITVDDHKKLGVAIAKLCASVIEPNRVDRYFEKKGKSKDYISTKRRLKNILYSSPDIASVYVYQIMPDGCHILFDTRVRGYSGQEVGRTQPFKESFTPYIGDMLSGKHLDPIITKDKSGWQMTVFEPVYNSEGICVCYVGVEISMNILLVNEIGFFARLITLFLGIFVLILVVGLVMAEYHLILPINTIAMATDAFVYNSEEAREDSQKRIFDLDIETGDEIENLYCAIVKMTNDNMKYVSELQENTAMIKEMQHGLILVLAEMVESRDKNTGHHVKHTAGYVKIIMEQMRREGIYEEMLTDEFIENVCDSAPLHDIGKITISDTILNKPGKLTNEEFEIMKTHAQAGGRILDRAIHLVPGSSFLEEARKLAYSHHERWDGKGYPLGLAGKDIPLSARIMSVADVFDALISDRSYKKGFSFEKSISIIREGVGSQFDPLVARAFLHVQDEAKRLSEEKDDFEG